MKPEQLLAHFDRLADAPDAIPRLRRFILDLAVRGKLVEQDPKDEPASELLKRIQSEKNRLVRDARIRKRQPYPAIGKETVPFPLPVGWVWCCLGELIHLVGGQHLKPGEYTHDKTVGPPYITGPADFGERGLVITRYAKVIKAVAEKGQILLTVKGAGVGKTAVCDLSKVAISRQLMAVTAIIWNDRFLLLTTHRLATALQENARSLIPGISREDVEQFIIGLPPLAEQHRIVAKVDELMALCDRLEATQAERESQRDRLVCGSLHRMNQPTDAQALRDHARFTLDHLPRLTTRPEHVQQLRETILNLAFRGKLIPQDPKEGTGKNLLHEVSLFHPRDRRFGSNRNKKTPIDPLNCPGIFDIPDTWSWSYLDFICEQIADVDHNMPKDVDKGVPFISAKDLNTTPLDLNWMQKL